MESEGEKTNSQYPENNFESNKKLWDFLNEAD
jgi:hypothetical protein